jgi:zinc/manganese transport system substrate-binding protein
MTLRRLPALIALLAAVAVIAGCGSDSGSSDAAVTAVATTPQVADLVRHVGGKRVDVHGVLAAGADPHGYEPRPSDAASIAEAAVVFKSGGEVDDWLDDLVDEAGGDAKVVELIDSVDTLEDAQGVTDPHWWQDPRNAVLAVKAIERALSQADPDGRTVYQRNAVRYTRRLQRLDARVASCLAKVPDAKRKIVTTHDSLGYLARRYDVEVIGSVIPSLSTQAQPSAGDIADLVDQVRSEGVEAVFPEAGADERLERALSRDAGAEVGAPLYADTLGEEGSGAETYVEAMAANAEALTEGMSGGRVHCPQAPG